jgi:tripartite-type tricarboxylate transporter receptor subunit TctC
MQRREFIILLSGTARSASTPAAFSANDAAEIRLSPHSARGRPMATSRKRLALFALCWALSAGVATLRPAAAQTAEQFYKGRTVTLVVGFAPGGINDISGRIVARHIGRFIPGHPTVVVQNMPGAGGLGAANRIYNVAEKDGSVIAGLGRSVPQLAIQGNPQVTFDPMKFTWLGSLSSYAKDAYLMTLIARHPARTVADVNKPGMAVNLGTDRAGATNVVFALIAKEVLGLQVNLVRGYQGAAPIFLAMQSGEVDGQVIGLSSIKAGQRDLWNRGQLRPLIQFGRTGRLPDLPDVPTGREVATAPGAQALLEFAELPFFMALPFVAPPGVPADRAGALQTAFMAMSKDREFLADAAKLGLDISPIDGAAIGRLLAQAAATPKDVIERFNAIEKK